MTLSSNTQNPEPKPKPNLKSLILPFKTRVALTVLNFITDAVRRKDGSVNRSVINFISRRLPANATPIKSVSTHDVTVNPANNLWFRLFIPHNHRATAKIPVVVFFHGGGFAFLSAAAGIYDAVCRRFARELNAVICSVEYRLAPEYKFPAQYDDGIDVLNFIDKHRNKIPSWPDNADVSRCFLAGDSAGGNISHHVAVRSCSEHFSDLLVTGLINIQPFFGGLDRVESEIELEGAPIVSVTRTDWMWKALLPSGLDADHWAVNPSGPNAVDLKGLDFPKTLLFIGGFDPLKDWQRKYCDWLRKCGKNVKLVEYNDAIHAFYLFPELGHANLLFDEIKEFINRRK